MNCHYDYDVSRHVSDDGRLKTLLPIKRYPAIKPNNELARTMNATIGKVKSTSSAFTSGKWPIPNTTDEITIALTKKIARGVPRPL